MHGLTDFSRARRLTLIGLPSDAGSSRLGSRLGAEALRITGLAESLRELGHAVEDLGDTGDYRSLRDEVERTLDAGAVPLVLGGDHAIAAGSIAGAARHCRRAGKPLFVLWLDAHADFNTPLSSPSGNLHGMPVAAVTGRMADEALTFGASEPAVGPERVFLFGIRSVDPMERRLVEESQVRLLDMRTIDEHGLIPCLRDILEEVAVAGGHLHVSLDVDFLDPGIAPGVATRVEGGASFREAHTCMEMIHDSGLCGSMDIVELNPLWDIEGKTARLLVDLAGSLFGKCVVDPMAANLPSPVRDARAGQRERIAVSA